MRIRINKLDVKTPFVLGEAKITIQLAGIAANSQCLFQENAFCPSENTVGLWDSLSQFKVGLRLQVWKVLQIVSSKLHNDQA